MGAKPSQSAFGAQLVEDWISWLEGVMRKHKISRRAVAREAEVGSSSLDDWVNRRVEPSLSNALSVAYAVRDLTGEEFELAVYVDPA